MVISHNENFKRVIKIKVSLKEILPNDYRKYCYLIYNQDGNFLVIYQAEYRWVLGGELYDCFIAFLKKRIGWKFCERRVRWRYHDNLKHQETEWKSIDDEFQEQVIDIDELYVDGKEQSIQ